MRKRSTRSLPERSRRNRIWAPLNIEFFQRNLERRRRDGLTEGVIRTIPKLRSRKRGSRSLLLPFFFFFERVKRRNKKKTTTENDVADQMRHQYSRAPSRRSETARIVISLPHSPSLPGCGLPAAMQNNSGLGGIPDVPCNSRRPKAARTPLLRVLP